MRLHGGRLTITGFVAVLAATVAGVTAQAGTVSSPDTPYTAQPKAGDTRWVQVAGAPFGSDQPINDTVPANADLYAVRFASPRLGFAAGSVCGDAAVATLDACPENERLPVIYRFTQPAGQPPVWDEVYRGTSEGFVAAIAFAADGHALAVGGTGVYPRREDDVPSGVCPAAGADDIGVATDPSGTASASVAPQQTEDRCEVDYRIDHDRGGLAQAWTWDGAAWSPVSSIPQLPGRGPASSLTALDCSPRPGDQNGEFCLAGGIAQIWTFENGAFLPTPVTDRSAPDRVQNAQSFRYRVRSIRFAPGAEAPAQPPASEAIAVTAGCCDSDPALDTPRAVEYGQGQWAVRQLENDKGTLASLDLSADQATEVKEVAAPRQTIPDSYYAVDFTGTDADRRLSVVASPGGSAPPDGAPEPASRVVGFVTQADQSGLLGAVSTGLGAAGFPENGDNTGDITYEALSPQLGDIRLVAGQGDDAAANPRDVRDGLSGTPDRDGVIDWAVGEVTATHQGLAFTTTERAVTPSPLHCSGGAAEVPSTSDCGVEQSQTVAGEATGSLSSHGALLLPTWSLNAYTTIPGTAGAWAVGDRGAIVSMGSGANGDTKEPNPAVVGTPVPSGARDTAYDGQRPAGTHTTGAVPPIAARPVDQVAAPQWLAGGLPDLIRPSYPTPPEEVSAIAMSRDGSEGWAVGGPATNDETTLYHFTQAAWRRCDTDGVSGALPADPACAALAGLRTYRTPGTHQLLPARLLAIARVPTEYGSDPTAAGDFEAVATATVYAPGSDSTPRDLILRYAEGRWDVDWTATRAVDDGSLAASSFSLTDVAFTSPDDGWIVANPAAGNSSNQPKIFHFDGTRWRNCTDDRAACGDDPQHPLLPLDDAIGSVHLGLAGRRLYLWGARSAVPATPLVGGDAISAARGQQASPLILLKDPGGTWTAQGGLDPGCASRDASGGCAASGKSSDQGAVTRVSVAIDTDGRYQGWAAGRFGAGLAGAKGTAPGETALARLAPGSEQWQPWTAADAAGDYLLPPTGPATDPATLEANWPPGAQPLQLLALPSGRALLALQSAGSSTQPLLGFDPVRDRWTAAPAPFWLGQRVANTDDESKVASLAPDGSGGAWAAVEGAVGPRHFHTAFFHFTNRVPRPVFGEVGNPVQQAVAAAAVAPDGTLWLATHGDIVYRYDRVLGWSQIKISGWDPGRVVTAASPAYAVAVGADGSGVVVGKGGRIADIGPDGVTLDAAAGRSPCAAAASSPPCGTGRDLHAAAVSPRGAALVGGQHRALLWRPGAGQPFQSVTPPPAPFNATITGLSMPDEQTAYATTNTGALFRGTLDGQDWRWADESFSDTGTLLAAAGGGQANALNAIAVGADGRGLAVGDGGVVLERTPGAQPPWHRVPAEILDDFQSVALAPDGLAHGALVGGQDGRVLTYVDGHVAVAREADPADPASIGIDDRSTTGKVVGVGLAPGAGDDETEAWAVEQLPPISQNREPAPTEILHYTSDPHDALLNPDTRVAADPDSPAPRPGEIGLVAFGKSDCQFGGGAVCPEMYGSNLANERINAGIVAALGQPPADGVGPAAVLFTGDVGSEAGSASDTAATPADADLVHRRWTELVADPLSALGVPVFGALGDQDLSGARACDLNVTQCGGTKTAGAGTDLAWRQAMAGMAAPWGTGAAGSRDGLRYVPVGGAAPAAPTGGARTHYAFDIVRDDKPAARIVVVDTSLRSLTASDAQQNPVEEQEAWLDNVLAGRPTGEPAVVLSEDPTYSYGPGALTDTQTSDATAFESLLFKDRVSAVVSGRLGWNALYWATSPGVHAPCPGGSYPARPPAADTQAPCSATTAQTGAPDASTAATHVSEALASLGAPQAPQTGLTGAIPFAVAASAGGKFGPDGAASGSAADGYWHGYSVIRVAADGDPGQTIVEQRPILDWIDVTAQTHTLHPGQRLALHGLGREPMGADAPPRFDDISSPAITHRYDLVEADPAQPWLPKVDALLRGPSDPNGYVPLDPTVATIDEESGRITAERSSHDRVYGLAILSVGHRAATWPVVFEPRRSYVSRTLRIAVSAIVAPVRVLGLQPASLQLPSGAPPAATPPPVQTNLSLPSPPALPSLPSSGATPAAPGGQQAVPLNLTIQPTGIAVPPTTGVTAQPTPPVNPSPPSGARREAKQRQAATAKSEEGGGDPQDANIDLAQGRDAPGGVAFSRRDRVRPASDGFTPLPRDRGQVSAWTTGLEWGGGLGIMAFALALGFTTVRPTPRRTPPVVPAPSWARRRR